MVMLITLLAGSFVTGGIATLIALILARRILPCKKALLKVLTDDDVKISRGDGKGDTTLGSDNDEDPEHGKCKPTEVLAEYKPDYYKDLNDITPCLDFVDEPALDTHAEIQISRVFNYHMRLESEEIRLKMLQEKQRQRAGSDEIDTTVGEEVDEAAAAAAEEPKTRRRRSTFDTDNALLALQKAGARISAARTGSQSLNDADRVRQVRNVSAFLARKHEVDTTREKATFDRKPVLSVANSTDKQDIIATLVRRQSLREDTVARLRESRVVYRREWPSLKSTIVQDMISRLKEKRATVTAAITTTGASTITTAVATTITTQSPAVKMDDRREDVDAEDMTQSPAVKMDDRRLDVDAEDNDSPLMARKEAPPRVREYSTGLVSNRSMGGSSTDRSDYEVGDEDEEASDEEAADPFPSNGRPAPIPDVEAVDPTETVMARDEQTKSKGTPLSSSKAPSSPSSKRKPPVISPMEVEEEVNQIL